MMKCQICGLEIHKNSFKKHLRFVHWKDKSISFSDFLKQYFDSFVEPNQEHKCLVCGNQTEFSCREFRYKKICSKRCRSILNNETHKEKWCKEHPGEKFTGIFGKKEIQDKVKKSVKEKYGVDNVSQLDFVKEKKLETEIKHFGKWHTKDKEIQERTKEKCLRLYGVECFNQIPEKIERCKETFLKKYGVDNCMKNSEILEKVYQSKLKNKTFFKSALEDKFFEVLKEIYPNYKILRQYKDERYKNPKTNYKFACDLYIEELDLFIEIQGYKTHGSHPMLITEKSSDKTYKSDCLKRSIAKINHLNFLEVFDRNLSNYTKENIKEFISSFFKSRTQLWNSNGIFETYDEKTKFLKRIY